MYGMRKYGHILGITTFIAISSGVRPRYLHATTSKYPSRHPNPGASSTSTRNPCFLPTLSNVYMINCLGSPNLMFCHPRCRRLGKVPWRYTHCTSKPSWNPPSSPHLEGRIFLLVLLVRYLTVAIHRHCVIGPAQTSCHNPYQDGQ